MLFFLSYFRVLVLLILQPEEVTRRRHYERSKLLHGEDVARVEQEASSRGPATIS